MAWVGPSKRTVSCGICGLGGSRTKALTTVKALTAAKALAAAKALTIGQGAL